MSHWGRGRRQNWGRHGKRAGREGSRPQRGRREHPQGSAAIRQGHKATKGLPGGREHPPTGLPRPQSRCPLVPAQQGAGDPARLASPPGHFRQRRPDTLERLLHHGGVLHQEEGAKEPANPQGLKDGRKGLKDVSTQAGGRRPKSPGPRSRPCPRPSCPRTPRLPPRAPHPPPHTPAKGPPLRSEHPGAAPRPPPPHGPRDPPAFSRASLRRPFSLTCYQDTTCPDTFTRNTTLAPPLTPPPAPRVPAPDPAGPAVR